MLLYYLFWMFMGFTLHFYIIFGTNLLNGGPACIAIFFAYFSISKKRNIKRSPNGMKPSRAWFLERTWSGGLGVQVKKQPRQPRGWGRAHPYRACPLSHGPLVAPPAYFFLLYIHTYPQTIRTGAKNLIPPPQLSVSTRSHLGACSGAPPEEGRHHRHYKKNTLPWWYVFVTIGRFFVMHVHPWQIYDRIKIVISVLS